MDDLRNLSLNIRHLIKAYKIRVGDLEDAIGVSRGYFSRSMGVDFPISKVMKIADFFEITVDDLVAADAIFEQLMGEEVEPRRKFIEKNARFGEVDI